MRKRVAIVARAGTNVLAPFRDPDEWDIWGIPWISYPRIDRAFEMHTQECADECDDGIYKSGKWVDTFNAEAPDAEAWCDKSRMHLFNNPVEYPLEAVKASLPIPTLENSISYLIALAIMEQRSEIALYGIHMWATNEATQALGSNAYLVGLAQGRGIKVTIPPGNPFLMSNFIHGRYGVRTGPAAMRPQFYSAAGVTQN